jgi:hypothetical protein
MNFRSDDPGFYRTFLNHKRCTLLRSTREVIIEVFELELKFLLWILIGMGFYLAGESLMYFTAWYFEFYSDTWLLDILMFIPVSVGILASYHGGVHFATGAFIPKVPVRKEVTIFMAAVFLFLLASACAGQAILDGFIPETIMGAINTKVLCAVIAGALVSYHGGVSNGLSS